MRYFMQKIKQAGRRLLGLDEDRASLWGGLHLLNSDNDALRHAMQSLRGDLDVVRILAGRDFAMKLAAKGVLPSLQAAEFKVFSQYGDDGIIQYLTRYLEVEPTTFIEFGVGDYRECNTRFLLVNNNWRGLIMDGNSASVAEIMKDPVCVFHDLTVACEFITRENINELFEKHGFTGSIGLLSVDIDGNDYWVWEAIHVVSPVIVVCEYNSVFGADRAITVPYDASFVRRVAHPSNLYYGTSLGALCHLAQRKGYAFVGCNSNGNNAYFVRRDRMRDLQELTPGAGYVESRFREALDKDGHPTFVKGGKRRLLIADCAVYDVEREVVGNLGGGAES